MFNICIPNYEKENTFHSLTYQTLLSVIIYVCPTFYTRITLPPASVVVLQITRCNFSTMAFYVLPVAHYFLQKTIVSHCSAKSVQMPPPMYT